MVEKIDKLLYFLMCVALGIVIGYTWCYYNFDMTTWIDQTWVQIHQNMP